jgi:biopolymer transport protein ExbD
MAMTPSPNRSSEPEVMLDINTTPLIDVMLVLLIMLIITIPVQLHAVHMDLPVAAAPPPQPPPVLQVGIAANGQVRVNGQLQADREALAQTLAQAARREPQPEVHIRADGQSRYADLAMVLAEAQRQGLRKLGVQ